MTHRRPGRLRSATAVLFVGLVAVIAAPLSTDAQAPARGQNIAPVYEGFWKNADGSFDLVFGYYNRNWEEQIDAPVGQDNHLQPGNPDQGQPTHFLPRRNQFVFKVRVPADFGDKEVVWTLTTNGVTERAYGTLRPQYVVDETVMAANFGAGGQTGGRGDLIGNTAPQLTLESPDTLTVSAGEPVTLRTMAVDDGKPSRRGFSAFLVGQSHFVPNSATGLRFSWFRYRGPGPVIFDPPQPRSGKTPETAATPRGRPAGSHRPSHPTTPGRCVRRSASPAPTSSGHWPTTVGWSTTTTSRSPSPGSCAPGAGR